VEKVIKHVNNFSGIWTLISIIIAVVIFFVRIDTTLGKLDTKSNTITSGMSAQNTALIKISEQLKDKDRDHIEFAKQGEKSIVILDRLSRVMIKLELTLDSMNKK